MYMFCRLLDSLSSSLYQELSSVYKEMVPLTDKRVIKFPGMSCSLPFIQRNNIHTLMYWYHVPVSEFSLVSLHITVWYCMVVFYESVCSIPPDPDPSQLPESYFQEGGEGGEEEEELSDSTERLPDMR